MPRNSKAAAVKMVDPIWGRQEFDTPASWQAFCDYKRMQVPRKLYELLDEYAAKPKDEKVPTRSKNTIKNWRGDFRWNERIDAYDAHCGQAIDTAVLKAREQKAVDELEEFASMAIELGRARYRITKQLLAVAESILSDGESGHMPENLTIRDVSDLGIIIRSSLSTSEAVELWAQSVGWAQVMERVEVESEEEETDA